jgi:hypothetical protein
MTTARDKIAEIIMADQVQLLKDYDFSCETYNNDPDNRNYALGVADAILAALPDMIRPLIWDGFHSGPYKIHVHEGGRVDLLFCGKAIDPYETHELLMGGYLTLVSIDDLKHEANTHHRAAIMDAFNAPTEPNK